MFWKYLLLLCALIFLYGGAADKLNSDEDVLTQTTDFSQQDDTFIDYRLPTSVKPFLYEIMLLTYLPNNFEFEGIAKINVSIENDTQEITLHVGKLIIFHPVSVIRNDTLIDGVKYKHDNITEKYTLSIPEVLNKGEKLMIVFTYKGFLNDNMIGFYRSSYYDEKSGELKWLAATQFQTTHARHAFPCFDEPSFKAKFIIRILRNRNYTCLSNMPLKMSVTQENDNVWDVFHESVPMSTYLVAFVISEFDFLKNSEQFKTWARPSVVHQSQYALTIGVKALKLFEHMFEQKYNLDKMDMVAVPDFSAGAMENWGLVTYRESRMLYDKNESSALAQQSAASVVVHEITHMWFGNLVTPQWWNYLWLSEGFARYFQYFATAEIETSWDMEQQFVVEQHQPALITDGLESSRPMTREVSSQSQIGGMGDSITYQKGASIVRMMSLNFGSHVFRPALVGYIRNNKDEGLGHPDALWKAIQNYVTISNSSQEISVKTIMDTWTTQAGYPVISVTIKNKIIDVTQERFLLRNLDDTSKNATWWVPLTWTTQSKPNFTHTIAQHWLSAEKITETIPVDVNDTEWVVFNVQSSGFYRVKYDKDGWRRIFNILNSDKFEEIHVLNRAGIVDDLLNLGRADYQDYDTVLNGLMYLTRETNYLPFKAAFGGLDYLNKKFAGNKNHSLFKKYVLSLISGRREVLKYEDKASDDRLTVLLRRELNNWACLNLGDDECITTYLYKFKKWRQNQIPIKPNERTAAYCVAIRYGTPEDWEFLWNKYYTSNYAADQTVIISALGCSENVDILEKYLGYAIAGYETSRIRKQDSTSVFAAVYNSGLIGAEYILDFVEKYHKEMEEYYGGQSTIASILNGASQRFSTFRLVDRFESFIKKHETKLAPIEKSVKSSLRIAEYELLWFANVSKSIVLSLRDRSVENKFNYRQLKDIRPTKYAIYITPNLEMENLMFNGNVTIEADVKSPTSQIVLHSVNITHNSLTVKANNTILKGFKENTTMSKYDFFIIDLAKELPADTKLIIEIEYTGYMNPPELRGFYRSSYRDDNGKETRLAATHLEPVGARRMFPCFDEPGLKAKFTVHVIVPPGYSAYSNTERNTELNNSSEMYSFRETVKMSTYLVAVIISDFKLANYTTKESKEYGVLARPNAINQSSHALSVMSPLVDFFETTFGQRYPISKLHMAALPDFPSGAGENWGLLTYRESNLLYDEDESSITSKQTITNVIAHEISHQWFGNLVTPTWWDYLWLNEGFARYFEYHASARALDNTAMESQFVVDELHSALRTDSLSSAHPLSHTVNSPTEIRSKFDTITYAKGASLLRMMEKTYGTRVLYEAFRYYLEKRKYDSVTPKDLYEALQVQVKHDVTAYWDKWTTQAGYPVVHVNINTSDNITTISLKQERFYLKKPERNTDDSDDSVWPIPITYVLSDQLDYADTTPKLWLTTKTHTFNVTGTVMLLNVQQSGYYRVNYDTFHWWTLINRLKSSNYNTIHEINRAALIDDLFNLARAGDVSYSKVLSAMNYLKQYKETNYLPWLAFYNNLPYLNDRFRGGVVENLYKKYVVSIIEPLYEQLGFNDNKKDDDYGTTLLRMHTRKWACEFDVKDCKYRALRHFKDQSDKNIPVPPNYRSVVYCTAMKLDVTNFTYTLLWEKYLRSNVVSDKLVILGSLACSQDGKILERLLLDAVKENHIRYQDSAKIFSSVYGASSIGVEAVIDTIRNHYDRMLRQNYNDYKKIATIVNNLASKVSAHNLYNQYQDLLDWLTENKPEFLKHVRSYKRKANYEREWYTRNGPIIYEELDLLNRWTDMPYRLSDTLYPERYNLTIKPDIAEGTFEGKVQICMTPKNKIETEPYILLNKHYYDLEIKYIRVYSSCEPGSPSIPASTWVSAHPKETLKIYLRQFISGERISVEIEYTGTISDNMEGLYRSFYFDKSGKQQWLLATQFQPTHARRVFPCFDEPRFKSLFTINIRRPRDYITRSNMPLLTHKNEGDYVWDIFEETKENVKTPTYLVAFVISKFTSTNTDARLRVVGRPEFENYTAFAEKIGSQILWSLEKYLLIKYPLEKLDLVGIPDFAMGAMENWGLVTFREYLLFHDEDEVPASYETSIITTMAHELSHMWFGNLVTCEWWEYIWLNEGFAEYMQWHISDRVKKSHSYPDQFVVYELQPALLKDTYATHAMTNPVTTPVEINDIFDHVTYGKSASVLRMIIETLTGISEAQLALYNYLNTQIKMNNGLAKPADLWKVLDLHYGPIKIKNRKVSVEEIMNTWTNQEGYPVVQVERVGYSLQLRQVPIIRFSEVTFFWIPITIYLPQDASYLTSKNELWLGPEPETVYINPANDLFVVNYQQIGFYRVNYDTDSWTNLINELNSTRFGTIHVSSRAQIIDDLFSLARVKNHTFVSYDTVMSATTYLKRETNHLPWKAFFNGMSFVYERFVYEENPYRDILRRYILTLISELYDRLGFDDYIYDQHLWKLNRELILQWACKLNNEDCIKQSVRIFNSWITKNVSVSPNARQAVYCTAIRQSNTTNEWSQLWERYTQTEFPSEKKIMINALGCSMNEKVLYTYLEAAIGNPSLIRKQDAKAVFTSVCGASQLGVNVTLEFLMKNIRNVREYFGKSSVQALFKEAASHISSQAQYNELKSFSEEYERQNSVVANTNFIDLRSALAIARENLEWYKKKDARLIEEWLKKFVAELPKPEDDNNASVRTESLSLIFTIVVTLISYFLS